MKPGAFSTVFHLRALRHRARPYPGPADARAYFDADADGRADDVAAYAEAFVQAHARADDARADQHGRRAAAARGRARRRGCCLRRLSPYLIARRRLLPAPSPTQVSAVVERYIHSGYSIFTHSSVERR